MTRVVLSDSKGMGNRMICTAPAIHGTFNQTRASAGGFSRHVIVAITETIARSTMILRAPRSASRSEEHTSELQSLMRNSYAVFCLKKNKKSTTKIYITRDNTIESTTLT